MKGAVAFRQNEQHSGGYEFGHGLFAKQKSHCWNPDYEVNPHLLIWGGSGSGKTRLLRSIIAYLQSANKHVHVLDSHGDLSVAGENSLSFGTRGQQYGINPFEYEHTEVSGPSAQAHEIVEALRKSYMPSMGPAQRAVLMQLVSDTYLEKGFIDSEVKTWLGVDSRGRLPSMEDLSEMITQIQQGIELGTEEFSIELSKGIKGLKKNRAQIVSKQQQFNKLAHNDALDPEGKKRDNLIAQIEEVENSIEKSKGILMNSFSEYIESTVNELEYDENGSIDWSFYSKKTAKTVLDSVSLYVDALAKHGVFGTTPPPVKAGLNRYDLSMLPDETRTMFVDLLVGKIFRACRMRGDYREKSSKARGESVDTYLVIDEVQSILPNAQKDRENPRQILNRVAGEARKYGLGLIVVSQSPAIFPKIFYTNINKKVGLKTNASDIPAAKRYLGVTETSMFRHIQTAGVALISNTKGDFDTVSLENW